MKGCDQFMANGQANESVKLSCLAFINHMSLHQLESMSGPQTSNYCYNLAKNAESQQYFLSVSGHSNRINVSYIRNSDQIKKSQYGVQQGNNYNIILTIKREWTDGVKGTIVLLFLLCTKVKHTKVNIVFCKYSKKMVV